MRRLLSSFLRDLRHSLRQLRRSPVFTLTVVVTLALGIGANTAVSSVFDQVLLRVLPVPHPEQLVRFRWSGPFSGSISAFGGDASDYFSYPAYRELRDQNKVFSGLLATMETNVALSQGGRAEDEDAEVVSGNYFEVLGLHPALGRLFTPQNATAPGANPVLVLSHACWKTRFAAAPDIVGKTLLVNHHPFTVVGVAPANFGSAIGGYAPGVFLPITMDKVAMPFMAQRDNFHNHLSLWLTLVGRLKPGVSPVQAQASLNVLWHALHTAELPLVTQRTAQFAQHFRASTLTILDDSAGFAPSRDQLRTPLAILISMAGLLVVMCVINLATLLLLRAAGRVREMSMRYALGARPVHIASQLLAEGGMFGMLGASLGLAAAPALTGALVRLLTHADPGSDPYSSDVDMHVLLFTLGVASVSSLLFSIAPVLQFLRPDLMQTLRQSAGTASRRSQRFRKAAVGVQIALSVLLLGTAGMFVRTVENLRSQSLGFNTSHLDTFSLDPTSAGYSEQQTPLLITRALAAIRQIPGVVSVSATTDPVLSDDQEMDGFSVQGYHPTTSMAADAENPWVMPGYFFTMGQPVLAGRGFTSADRVGAPKVAVINLAAAKLYFGSAANALGRMVGNGRVPDTTIVGVAGDTRHFDLHHLLGPAVYEPYLQQTHPGGVAVYARTALAPGVLQGAIRKAMRNVDSTLVINGMRTMDAQVNLSAQGEEALAILALCFAALAMTLAAVGLYGVLSYATSQRTREIGVRLALGAQRSNIVFVILREMLVICGIATLVSLPGVVIIGRIFASQLYGVSSYAPANLVLPVLLIALLVAAASALPARRAAGVEPVEALRTE